MPGAKRNVKKHQVKPKSAVSALKVPKQEHVPEKKLRRKINKDCQKVRVGPQRELSSCPFRTLSSIPMRFQRVFLGFTFARQGVSKHCL